MRNIKNAYKIFVRKLEGKRLFERHRFIWEDNIKMYFKGLGREVWTRFNWFRMGYNGGIFWVR